MWGKTEENIKENTVSYRSGGNCRVKGMEGGIKKMIFVAFYVFSRASCNNISQ